MTSDLVTLLALCYLDPLLFVERVLRAKPRAWQRRALEALAARLQAGERRLEVLIRACHSSGKSWLTAAVLLWYVSTRPEARGLVLAPKWQTIEEVVFAEVRRLYAGSVLADLGVGRCLMTSFELGPAWFVSGAASDKPETLEGQHSPTAALRVIDEAKSVPGAVFVVTEGILASPESLDLWISTPSVRAGDFYRRDVFGGPRVLRFVVTAADLVEEGIPGIREWRDDCAERWGVDSAAYRSRVMAEYVEEGGGSLYPFSAVEHAMAATWDVEGAPVAGFDVAGSTDGDESVIALAYGPDKLGRYRVRLADSWQEQNTMLSKGRALAILRAADASSVAVDSVGLGAGVRDALALDFPACYAYRASEAPADPVQFLNRKAEDAWHVRTLLEKGFLRLPDDPVTRAQFLAMKFEINAAGKIRILDPSDSPDRHDAVCIALSAAGGAPLTRDMISFGASDSGSWGDASPAWGNAPSPPRRLE